MSLAGILFLLPSPPPSFLRGRGAYGLRRCNGFRRGRRKSRTLPYKIRLTGIFPPASPGGYERSDEEEESAESNRQHEGEDVTTAKLSVRPFHPDAQDQRQHEAQFWHPSRVTVVRTAEGDVNFLCLSPSLSSSLLVLCLLMLHVDSCSSLHSCFNELPSFSLFSIFFFFLSFLFSHLLVVPLGFCCVFAAPCCSRLLFLLHRPSISTISFLPPVSASW